MRGELKKASISLFELFEVTVLAETCCSFAKLAFHWNCRGLPGRAESQRRCEGVGQGVARSERRSWPVRAISSKSLTLMICFIC